MYNRKAIKHYEEGREFHHKGNLSAAERAYKKAIKINHNFTEAHSNLGSVYLNRDRYDEAINQYRQALKVNPEHPILLNNIGYVLLSQGEYEKALIWFNRAISRDPGYADAHSNLGNVFWSLDRVVEAIAAYKRAIKLNPDFVYAYVNLGDVLIELDQLEEALDCFEKALSINPASKNAYRGLGRVRSRQGDLNLSVAAYRKAIAIDPANEQYYKELGEVYHDHGEAEAAVTAYRKVVEINPDCADAYRLMSRAKKFIEYDDDMRAMESLRSSKNISDEDSMNLAFALGKAFEDVGEFEKSMAFVIEATQLKRSSIDYSISESQEQFDRVKEVFSPDFFASHADIGDPDRTPIFILGMPRSGTSLVEQILASHPDVFGAGELTDLGLVTILDKTPDGRDTPLIFPEMIPGIDARSFTKMGRQYVARIRKYSTDAIFITDKLPHNFMRIGLIKTILPNAKIIHCTRNPMDNCLSLFKNLFSSGQRFSYDLVELGQYFRMYLDLMNYWNETLPGYIYDLSYENLVESQQQQVSNLLEHCGLPWNDACLNFHKTRRKVSTASNAQVRRPIYKDSVKLWKRYEKQLQPLKEAIYG